MPSIIDLAILYLISLLPSFILAFLTVLVGLSVYYFGKKENLKLMDESFEILKHKMGDWIVNTELAEMSTVGRTYLVKMKEDNIFTNFRIHFTMVHRHLVLSRIGSILRKRRDYVLLEADPTVDFVKRYQLEILPKNETKRIEALSDVLLNLKTIELGHTNFDETFIMRVNAPSLFLAILKNKKNLTKNLFAYRNMIVRISFYPLTSPSLRIVAELSNRLNFKHLLDILSDLTVGIMSLGKKGLYAKERTSIRIVRDKDLEKDREKKYRF